MEAAKATIQTVLEKVARQGIEITDILEMIILAFAIYHIILWIRKTQAWLLLKGVIVILIFLAVAAVLRFHVIMWIFKNSINVVAIGAVIVFQPELRKALDQLGRKNPLSGLLSLDEDKKKAEKFSNRSVTEIVRAVGEMAKVKTGALIVMEQETPLNEYERTGIKLDSIISSQLLINIFEHNTPLHDGAVILRQDRIVAATCYLPLSDNMELSKALGTRHRAAVGLSEVTDSLVIVVSEETGRISVASGGVLKTNVDSDYLKERLKQAQGRIVESRRIKLWRGRQKDGKKAD
ncbi:diadenylate cyclase CdaA [Anaerolentibacter hominis]|uniref:diadenylate cyclase CdaA n=1 Tax=Anaerolentibacter hominis TaxID=3079009 RepID=UPI0031B80B6E